ncbi:MAG: ATP-binding cassette domain-containing protein [Actinomycetota bacterium]|nr:ATP-binding cassette domain-containing protein [Actinomycetota bacterium]
MIEVRELTKRYGSTVAVDGLSFDVRPGRVTGFLGPNGAGKSTTMRVIVGLDSPTSGAATINGSPYRQRRFPLHEVGALLDAQALPPGRSAAHHLLSIAQSNRIGPRRVQDVLELVGLSDVAGRRVGPFSLGMKQRLGIAAVLLGDPEVLLFDEPVTGLDPEGIVWIRNLFHRLADEGRTVFVSSHLMSEMAQTARYLVVIGRGKLIAEGSLDEILATAGSTVRVGSPRAEDLVRVLTSEGATVRTDDGALSVSGLDAARIGDLAAQHQIALHELTPQRASLEEVFFDLTKESVDYRAEREDQSTHAEVKA